MLGIINYTVLVLSMTAFFEVHGQRERARSLIVVSKHEPTNTKDAPPKSQQTLVVSPGISNTILSRNSLDPVMFPSQLFSNFMPRGVLSDFKTTKDVAPTAISPITTTSPGSQFNGITQSMIHDMVQKVKQEAENQMNLMKPNIQKELTIDPNNLSGIIKATAEKKIREILSSSLGGLNKGILHNTKNTAVAQKETIDTVSVMNNEPLVLQNLAAKVNPNIPSLQSSIAVNSPPSLRTSFAPQPLVLARQPFSAPQPLVLAPNPPRAQINQQNIQLPTRTQEDLSTAVNRERMPAVLHPSRMRTSFSSTRTAPSGSSTAIGSTNNRNVPSTGQTSNSITLRAQTSRNVVLATPSRIAVTPRRQTTRTRQATTVQRNGARTLTIRRQQTRPSRTRQSNTPEVAATRDRRCPSQSDCPTIVPANCRRPSYITDDNGRRICRGCDEDRCAFAGFEQRWGRGFG